MGVLIAFVTPSDPAENPHKPGPASVLTAVKALRPQYIYLLYTNLTEENLRKTKQKIEEDPDFRDRVIPRLLDLPDARDYRALADLLPGELRDIASRHPGQNFYLVSGHPQVRTVMALCLSSYVLEGELYEVSDPDPQYPETREGYLKRLRQMPIEVIKRFRFFTAQHLRWQEALLRIDLELQEAYLRRSSGQRKWDRMDLRSRGSVHRTFELLAFLALKRCYGTEPEVDKSSLKERIYSGLNQSNIPKAIKSINKSAKRISGRELVESTGTGFYRLVLSPRDIGFKGDITAYLEKRGYPPEEFPNLF